MKKINKLASQNQHSSLTILYQHTKALEKHVQGTLEKLTQQYHDDLSKIKQATDYLVEVIKQKEESAFQTLDQIKDEIIQSMDSRWREFKEYSRLIRKVCLGEESDRQLPQFQLDDMRELLDEVQSKIELMNQASNKFCSEFQEISQAIVEPSVGKRFFKQERSKQHALPIHFDGISPIKPNLRMSEANNIGITNLQSRLQLKSNTVNLLIQELNSDNQEKNGLRKLKTETAEVEKIPQNNFYSVYHQARQQMKKSESVKIIPEIGSLKSPSISKTKRTVPNAPNISLIKQIQSPRYATSGRLKKLSNSREVLLQDVGLKEGAMNFSTNRNRQLLTGEQKKAVGGASYKSCLQRLQKQQFQYEKIRKGLY